jgi:hypothetical protein
MNADLTLLLIVVAMCALAVPGQALAAEPSEGLHPWMLFGAGDLPALRTKAKAEPLLADCLARMQELAHDADVKNPWATLEARAFLWQLERQPALAERATALLAKVAAEDPVPFYAKANFDAQAAPCRAMGLAWDWLYETLSPEQRDRIRSGLENWVRVLFEHTEKQWWREASYNVGAIPVAGYGLLALALRGESNDPAVARAYREAVRRIAHNYFTNAWRPSGICYEGPNYAIVGLRYPAVFAEALRRAGGPDLLANTGARSPMPYLMYQWMPMEGCAPIGDNTNYGRRTFAAEYLLGLRLTADRTGLWTWKTFTDTRRLDPLITYLWFPVDLAPQDPAAAGLPTSRSFEITPNRDGYVFARSAWNDPQAAFFAFVTRFDPCNHQHYDMQSILFGGRGTLFATHKLLYPYGHIHQGADFEHNHVVMAGAAWPANNLKSCGDDNSTDNLLVGLALGCAADYTRADGKWSYRDNHVPCSNPAIRADRACLFVKSGAVPYLLVVDDIQFTDVKTDYDWLWHAPLLPITGKGTGADPLVIAAVNAECAISFVEPAAPALTVGPAENAATGPTLNRIAVRQSGARVKYVALASVEKVAAERPKIETRPVDCRHPGAFALAVVSHDGHADLIAWQPEEDQVQKGVPLKSADLETDGLLALVRTKGERVVAYVLGEGTYLRWKGQTLVQVKPDATRSAAGLDSVCVSAGPGNVQVAGRRRARENLPPCPPGNVDVYRP